MSIEVEYPIPKKCVVCRENFYVGMKIKKASNNINQFYSDQEKIKILLYLNQIFPNDVTRNIIKFLKNIIIYNFGHISCCKRSNKNITWFINTNKDLVIYKYC